MRLSAGQIHLCVFCDHNFSDADRHLSLFFFFIIFLRKADGQFVLPRFKKKKKLKKFYVFDHHVLQTNRMILVANHLDKPREVQGNHFASIFSTLYNHRIQCCFINHIFEKYTISISSVTLTFCFTLKKNQK